MPFVEHKIGREFNTYETPQVEKPEPGLWDTFEAGFQMENPVLNAAALMSRPAFEPQEGFKVGVALRDYDVKNRTFLFEQYKDRFLGIQSEDEMNYQITKIREQEDYKDTLSRAGWLGVVAGVTGGLVSPEVFIPLVGQFRGVKALAQGAALGFATALPAESILYTNQPTRTKGDVAFSLAASTALGGILGGAVAFLRPGERELFEQEISRAARPQSVGAAAVDLPDPGGLASGAQTAARINDKTLVFTNPVTQTINQKDFPTWRVLMQQASDSGLAMERNVEGVATSLGGTIENRSTTYIGLLGSSIEKNDELYSKYFFDNNVPSIAPNLRAKLGGTFNAGGKISRAQFEDEITKAIRSGFEHEIPEVKMAAAEVAKQVFEPILKEAQKVKLLGDDVEVVGDKAYVTRIYNTEAIQTNTTEFVDKLASNYEKQLTARFTDELSKFNVSQTRKQELVDDVNRPESEIENLTKTFKDELQNLEDSIPEDIQNLENSIAVNRATARAMLNNSDTLQNEATRKQLLKDARDMERASPEYQGIKTRRAELRRRLRNLSKAVVAVDKRQAAKLERIEKIDELNIGALTRVANKAQATLKNLARWSDDKLDEEVSRLRTMFETAGKQLDKGDERYVKLVQEEGSLAQIGGLERLQTSRVERLNNISQRLDNLESLDREGLRETIQEGLESVIENVNDINSRRTLRAQRLREQAAKLDPELARERIRAVQDSIPRAAGDFARKWETLGAEGVEPSTGIANFKDVARRSAEQVKDTIVGTYQRLPYSEILGKERGSELVRVLDIPSAEIEKFLENNINKITKTYVRTMAPDIEIVRKYGSLDWRQIILPAVDELNVKLREVRENPKLTEAQKDKGEKKLNEDFALYRNNFTAVMERLRGTRGMPADPDGFAYRAARTVMNLNVARMMGMVTVSSIPDMGRPIMRYGLTRTFRDGFAPLISNLKAFQMNAREAKLSGAAMEIVTHQRAMAVRDITDELQRGSKFEKGVEWLTNKMGAVALFDYWTQGGKLLTSSVANAKLMESLAKINTGEGTLAEKAALDFLAQNGIDGNLAERMWKEVTENGGGGKVNGTWWPNTESWKDIETVQAYRAALAREINNTIITPGVERPLLSDANIWGRMLYQFKSFGMSATPKLMMAGMQQRDAAFLSGSLASLGLGALSYYLWATATGGKAYTEMLNADLDKWADEAISRSGLIAGAGEVQRIAQTIPLLSNYASFSGTRQTRRPGDDIVESLLGPSFDFGKNLLGVIGTIHEPTQGTVRQFVNMLPYQNALGLREAIEAVENAISSRLPERKN
jgi:hypothetical protein